MNAVTKILLSQLGIALVAGMVAWLLLDAVAGYSVVLGGLVCFVPTMFLGMRMLAAGRSQNPRKMLNATYVGEAVKWFLTFGLFILIYQWIEPLKPGALLAGFILTQGGVWLAILTDKHALTS